ncbi:MAG TPA: arsenate reductase ArsC [Allosphingosinicella sp.]
MTDGRKILFLCTGNSARSILAEAILNREGEGRFRAFSAGSFPKGRVHPAALELLGSLGFPTAGLRSKSWEEFALPDSPPLDLVITVCDDAAGEVCPVWPGKPIAAHWGIEDPARVEGPGRRRAFETAFHALRQRISLLLALPLDSLDRMSLQSRLDEIGGTVAVEASA